MILAGDVGGTKIRLGLYRSHPDPGAEDAVALADTRLETAAVSDLAAAVRTFLTEARASATTGSSPLRAVCLGVAGPVEDGRVVGANLPWPVAADPLSAAADGAPVLLLNDLVASAHALDSVPANRIREIHAGDGRAGAEAPRGLLSPGTGLGECFVAGHGPDLVAFGSEGGHADFGPTTEEQAELWRFLRRRLPRVSWEAVVSGPGIVRIHGWLRSTGRFAGDPGADLGGSGADAAARISAAALAGSSGLCLETLRIFAEAFGAEAGNVALRGCTRGGIYLGGGIPPKIAPLLEDGAFLGAFLDKTPQRDLVDRIPVRILLAPDLALEGARRVANARAGASPE